MIAWMGKNSDVVIERIVNNHHITIPPYRQNSINSRKTNSIGNPMIFE